MNKEVILVTGALGQIGADITLELVKQYGTENVIATDVRDKPENYPYQFQQLNVLDQVGLSNVVKDYNVTTVYHLAAMLSGVAEKNPLKAWELNTESLLFFLELAKEKSIQKLFWPSSIAVFGKDAPKQQTPQNIPLNPNTVYGISKLAGEQWCQYYYDKYGVDVRSVRYPGLISWKAKPGGGTTDYAVDIFHQAIENNQYECFLHKDTALPMLFMQDAIDVTLQLMQTPKDNISIRTSYNVSGISFTPKQLATEINKHLPEFSISYKEDFRQQIADSWPNSISDTELQKDLQFTYNYNLAEMVSEMLEKLKQTALK